MNGLATFGDKWWPRSTLFHHIVFCCAQMGSQDPFRGEVNDPVDSVSSGRGRGRVGHLLPAADDTIARPPCQAAGLGGWWCIRSRRFLRRLWLELWELVRSRDKRQVGPCDR